MRGGSTCHNMKNKTITHGSGNAHFLRPVHLFIGDVEPDVHSWHLLYEVLNVTSVHGNASLCPSAVVLYDCAHAVFVSSMFTLSVTEADTQPIVVSHYGQIYRSQKVCVSGHMFTGLFFLVWWVLPSPKILDTFLTHCISTFMCDLNLCSELISSYKYK